MLHLLTPSRVLSYLSSCLLRVGVAVIFSEIFPLIFDRRKFCVFRQHYKRSGEIIIPFVTTILFPYSGARPVT